MTRLMYEVPSDPTISRIIITADSVTQHKNPIVEHDEERLKRPLPRLGAAEQEMNRTSSGNAS